MKPRPSSISSACSLRCVSPVTASRPAGSARLIRSTSWSGVTPDDALTLIAVNSSLKPNRRWASLISYTEIVAPRRESSSPKLTMPTSSNCSAPARLTMVTVSPSSKSFVLTVLASMATSPGPAGALPLAEAIRIGFKDATSPHENPSVGGPLPPIGSPSLSRIWLSAVPTPPSASSTPSTVRMSSRTDAGNGSSASVNPSASCRTVTSIPA